MKIKNLSQEETDRIVPKNTILLGYVGSISHGTQIPSTDPDCIDDIDIMGVCVASPRVYLGLGRFEQRQVAYKEWDSVVYEIRKLFNLLLKGNPNVLGLLWLKKENYIFTDDDGKEIISNRNIFSSKESYHSFVGYAHSQLKRMTHYKFEGYMGEKRKQLVDRFGYDTKNAAHLIRLLRMGIEFLTDGELRVFRNDAEELKQIKRGEWTLEKIQETANNLFALAQEAFVRSELPPHPDYEKAENLLMKIVANKILTQKN